MKKGLIPNKAEKDSVRIVSTGVKSLEVINVNLTLGILSLRPEHNKKFWEEETSRTRGK